MTKEAKTMLSKMAISDVVIDRIVNEIKINNIKTIAIMFFNTRKIYVKLKKKFPDCDIYFIDVEDICMMYPGKENIVTDYTLRNVKDMHFDLVIANPAFDAGNAITKAIIDNIDYKQFINVLPKSKYKPNNLFRHIDTSSIINLDSCTYFGDAATWPIIVSVSKEELCDDSFELFDVKYLYDIRLRKFWDEQLKRSETYVRHWMIKQEETHLISSKTSYCCGIYTPVILTSNGPKTILNKDGSFKVNDRHYIWNFLKPEGIIDDYYKKGVCQTVTTFKTETEADNFKAWAHSGELTGKGRLRGLFSILLRCTNISTSSLFPYAIPRVDWSRPWTDEEILKDYGYTDSEIEVIMHINDDIKGN